MLSVSSAAIGYAPVTAPLRQPRADVRMETMSDLDALAQKLNPKVGLYAALAAPRLRVGVWVRARVTVRVEVRFRFRVRPRVRAGRAWPYP